MESDDSITLVHTAWKSYNEQTHTASNSPQQPFSAPITDGKQMLEAILTQTSMPVIQLCTSLYRTDVVRDALKKHKALFRGQDIVCEDLQIAFFEALNGNIAFIPDVTLYYSQGGDTISSPRSIRKLFDFYNKATNQSHTIANTFSINTDTTRNFFSKRTYALLMHAFRAKDQQMRSEAIECQKLWNTKNNLAILMIKAITAFQPLWTCALAIRKVVITLKK
jgi:hypothetical protein